MGKPAFLCKSHPDFHIPPGVEVGLGFDGEAYTRGLKDAGADAVAFFAKCHYGHSYYHTSVGNRHPRLKKDMLGEVVAGCRRNNLGAIAYYSVFLDSAAARAHPDWRLQSTRDAPKAGYDSGDFQPVCVNSPYVEELFLPQTREIVGGYDVDEMFFDTMTNFNPCYCIHCRRSFGRDIPNGGDPHWLEYVGWYARQYESFFARAAEAVHQARADVDVTFNWEWGIRRPTNPPAHVTRLAADLLATGTIAALNTRYFAGAGLPGDYMTGRFLHGLREWDSNSFESLRYTAAVTVANGSSFYLIDRQLPDGSIEPRGYEAMRDVFGFLQQRREFLIGAAHVAEIAVLHSYAHIMGPNLEYFPEAQTREKRAQPYEGVVRLFIEHARHFTALNAENLRRRLADYRLVILPEQEHVEEALRDALTDYVKGGGRLLITQSSSGGAVDARLLDLAGVRYQRHAELDYGYLQGHYPILVRGHFAQVTASEASAFCPVVLPLTSGEFGHGFAPPAGRGPFPGATRRTLGRGEIVYVAAPVFKAYQNHQNPHLGRLILSWVDHLLPDPIARLSSRAQIELSLARKGDDLLIHLVNHSGRERLGGYFYPCTEYIPEIRQIELSIRLTDKNPAIFSVPSRQAIHGEIADGYTRLIVPPLHVMESILVADYFAPRGD